MARVAFHLQILPLQARRQGFEDERRHTGESVPAATFLHMMCFIAVSSEGLWRARRLFKRMGWHRVLCMAGGEDEGSRTGIGFLIEAELDIFCK